MDVGGASAIFHQLYKIHGKTLLFFFLIATEVILKIFRKAVRNLKHLNHENRELPRHVTCRQHRTTHWEEFSLPNQLWLHWMCFKGTSREREA